MCKENIIEKCPCCGSSVIVNIGIQEEGKLTPYNVECFNCGVRGTTENSKWGAIETWNQITEKCKCGSRKN